MSISPTSFTDPSWYYPDVLQPSDDESPPTLPVDTGIANGDELPASGLNSIESGFTSLISSLGSEFMALQQQLGGAVRSLFGSPSAVAAPASGTDTVSTLPGPISPYDGIISKAAARHGVDPRLVRAVICQESGGNRTAVSPAGAMGLMQLMPQTAKDLGVNDPFDAAQNIEGGTQLLGSLIHRYGGRVDLALAAYNAGPGAVDRYGGIPPYAETHAYVDRIIESYGRS
jgi:soluble lytic murein transglycosylase-like protein